MQQNGNKKTAFVLAGGGSLGAVQVGMLKVLASQNIVPDFVVGAAVGACGSNYTEQMSSHCRQSAAFLVSSGKEIIWSIPHHCDP
jgi:predicted acylesterase/phospholipase RssA